jgi:hypothetical protein
MGEMGMDGGKAEETGWCAKSNRFGKQVRSESLYRAKDRGISCNAGNLPLWPGQNEVINIIAGILLKKRFTFRAVMAPVGL